LKICYKMYCMRAASIFNLAVSKTGLICHLGQSFMIDFGREQILSQN
jgi:hypothetical protein